MEEQVHHWRLRSRKANGMRHHSIPIPTKFHSILLLSISSVYVAVAGLSFCTKTPCEREEEVHWDLQHLLHTETRGGSRSGDRTTEAPRQTKVRSTMIPSEPAPDPRDFRPCGCKRRYRDCISTRFFRDQRSTLKYGMSDEVPS
ncbi:unnamed protein product, partial [Cyprideis torosa]